jgi:hypothetical protein
MLNKRYLLMASLLSITGCDVIHAVNKAEVTDLDRGITIIDADGNIISPVESEPIEKPIRWEMHYTQASHIYELPYIPMPKKEMDMMERFEYNIHRNKFNKKSTHRNQLVHRTRSSCGYRHRA